MGCGSGQMKLLGLESFGDVVWVQSGERIALLAEGLGHVLGRHPRLGQGSGAHWQVTEQLDVDEAVGPRRGDDVSLNLATDREMGVEAVVRSCATQAPRHRRTGCPRSRAEHAEELGQVRPERRRGVVALTGVGERAHSVQTVRGAVPAQP